MRTSPQAIGLLALSWLGGPGAAAAQTPAGVEAPPGFAVTPFAAPPMVAYPVAIAAAPDGTVYVAVDRNGSIDREAHRGSVVRLRDTDGDGRADESKRFVAD